MQGATAPAGLFSARVTTLFHGRVPGRPERRAVKMTPALGRDARWRRSGAPSIEGAGCLRTGERHDGERKPLWSRATRREARCVAEYQTDLRTAGTRRRPRVRGGGARSSARKQRRRSRMASTLDARHD